MTLSRITNHPVPSHPPCPERCWERVGDGWRYTGPANTSCRWDGERTQWTQCNVIELHKEPNQ